MSKKLKFLAMMLTCILLSINQVWGTPAPAETVLYSENFGGYSDTNVPSGTASSATGYRVVYSGSVTYTCTNGQKGSGNKAKAGGTTQVTTANGGNLAGGASPELMVGKKGTGTGATAGTFAVSGIPNGGAAAITVSYKQNAKGLKATISGSGYSTSFSSSSSAGTTSFDITVANDADATFSLTLEATGTDNVRVDDISITVKTAGSGGSTYTLTFKDPDGTTNGSTTSISANATTFGFGASAPSKTGYHITGFYKEAGLSNKIANPKISAGVVVGGDFCASTDYTNSSSQYTAGANHDLYLQWAINHYAITYDKGENGTGDAISNGDKTHGTNFTLSSSTYSRVGYTQTGWSTTDGGDKAYNLGGTYSTDADITLYPYWEANTYTVHWYVNGSTWEGVSHGSPTTSGVAHGGKIATFPTSPTAAACDGSKEFVGWTATSIVGTTNTKPTFVSPQTAVTGNLELHAVFATRTANSYTKGDVHDLITGKNVLIVNEAADYALSNANREANKKLVPVSVANSTTLTNITDATIIWTVYNSTGATYQFKIGDNYLRASGTESQSLYMSTTADTWNVTSGSSNYRLWSTTRTNSYYLEYYKPSGDNFFTTYAYNSNSANNYDMSFFVPTYSAYQTACCTQYNVTLASSGSVTGGTFETDKTKACEGATVTLTATPSANYRFNSWTISKAVGTVTPADASSASTTFTMPGEAVTVTASFAAKCQTPTFSVSEGTYNNDQLVTITCATSSATIKYTTDGSDPATYGTTYSGQVTINADNTTLKAVAIKASHENSEVASATYRLKCATPTFTPTPGLVDSKYLGTQSVAFNTTTTGSITFYYTTDGSTTPTTSSTEYSSAIDVSSTTTLKAIATKANYQNSDVATQTFTITNAYTVTWMNRGSLLTTTRVEEGEKPTFPTTAKTGCDTYTSFYGWANNTWNGGKTTIAAPPAGLAAYTTSSAMPDVDGDVTYHAVWTNSFRNVHTSNLTLPGSSPTNGIKCQIHVESGDGYASYTAFKLGKTDQTSANITVTVPANTTYLSLHGVGWNSGTAGVVVSTEAEGVEITTATSPTTLQQQYNARGNITTSDDILFNEGHDFVEYSLSGVSTATTLTIASSGYPIIIWGINSATASGAPKYITSCCDALSDANASVKSSTYNSVTLQWDNIANVDTWAVTCKKKSDGTSAGTPSDISIVSTKKNITFTGLDQYTDYVFTISATADEGYCDTEWEVETKTPCVAPSSLSIASTNDKWDFCAGESMTLTVSGTNVSASATYQWQKWNGSSWDDIGGAESASYTVASMAASNAGQYRCTVTNPGSSCDATTDGAWVRLWQLYINNGTADAFQSMDFSNTGTGTGSNTSVYLTSDKGYQFKLIDNNGGYFGLNSKTVTTNESNITLNGTGANVNVTSGLEGNYTFAIDYTSKNNPKVSITYPVGNQPAGRKIWFDKSVITGWTDAGTGDLVWRIGKKANSMTNKDDPANAFTLVPGTDRFYVYETKEYNGFEAWHVANNVAWSGNSDNDPAYDNHSIYTHYHNQNSTDVKYATVYQKYVIGTSGVTLVPTTKKNTDWYCDFWNVTKYDGMLTHNASITAYSHGTVTVAYTNTSSVASSFTSGDEDLAHRCILTITAVPDPGYNLTSLQVNSANFTSGNEYILSADATITAVFSPKTITITWDGNGGNTPSPTESSYTYNGSTVSLATVTHATKLFAGWFTDPSAGTQITEIGTTNKPTADVTYYAHWVDGNTVYFHPGVGSVTPTSVTQTSLGGAVDIPTPTIDCDGWSFAGWNIGSELAETMTNPEASLQAAGSAAYVPASTTVHMYAVWKKNFGGGTGTVNNRYDWEAANSSWSTSSISAVQKWNGGTYVTPFGSYSGNTSASGAYVRYLSLLASPDSITFEVTKASNNSNDNNRVYVETSTNGTSWTELAGTSTATNALTRGTWQHKNYDLTSKSNIYVRLYWTSASVDALALDNVTVYYEGTIPDSWKWTSTAEDYGCVSANQVKTPVISPNTEAQTGDVSVTITCATDGATIRYTTDGTDPTSSSGTVYSSAFTVSCSATVKAIAYKATMDDSNVATQDYTVTVPTPEFGLAAGTYYDANQSVTLSLPTAHTGTVIKYTTNGDDPTSSSATYSSAITVTEGTTTIKAIGYNSTCSASSAVASATYIVRFGTDYTLVTDANDLMAGDKIVIISSNSTTETKKALSTKQNSNNRDATNDYNINNTLTVAKIYPAVNEGTTVDAFTLVGEPGSWGLKGLNNKYLGIGDTEDARLRSYDESYHASNTYATKWSISITSNIATIANIKYTSKDIQLNNNIFAAYGNVSQTSVKIYSLPNPTPVIKVEGVFSAFSTCYGTASSAQTLYVSGRSLTGNMVISGPTGYEFSSDGSSYSTTLTLVPSTGLIARQLVYVRLSATATSGAHNGNVNVAVSANSLTKDVTVTGSVSTADIYIDRVHNNTITPLCGSYSAPSCTDEDVATSGSCNVTHYKFMGWVAESDLASLTNDAAYKSHLITSGTAMTADGTTYYAVWAEEE